MRIFYVTSGQHVAGGQLVNLDHVATLRSWGHDARHMIINNESGFAPVFPAGLEAPWQVGAAGLTADDVVVVGEMFGAGMLAVKDSLARKVIHNQNPHYLFHAFSSVQIIETWGASHMLCCSHFTAGRAREAGWRGPTSVVRPYIAADFHGDPAAPRTPAVVTMPRKRPTEAKLIRGLLRSRRPDLKTLAWVELAGLPRADCALLMKEAGVFLSLSHQEGLGLPPLEAMAAGALVVGYHGSGGLEYATPQNGDWFDDGHYSEIADTLAARLDGLIAGDAFTERRAAGISTAAQFSKASFDAELRASWTQILAGQGRAINTR